MTPTGFRVDPAYTSALDAARAFLTGQDTAMASSINYFAFNDKFAK